MVAHIVPQGAELPFPALVKGYLVGIGLILLLQYTGAVLRVIAASHLPVEMEYQRSYYKLIRRLCQSFFRINSATTLFPPLPTTHHHDTP